jgi:hypothetical protein
VRSVINCAPPRRAAGAHADKSRLVGRESGCLANLPSHDVSNNAKNVNVFVLDMFVFNSSHANAKKDAPYRSMKEYLELVDVLGCEGPGFTAMKNGVDRNSQEDQFLGK